MPNNQLLPYQRDQAVAYATQWALSRNPRFYDYSSLGGDCTNFASQCILAGGTAMNFDPNLGWFYLDGNRKSPSWTGVEFLYQFLVNNQGPGPYAVPVNYTELEPGDIIQLSFVPDKFGHSPVVTRIDPPVALDRIYVSAHTYDALNVKLTQAYSWREMRCLHILGSRQ